MSNFKASKQFVENFMTVSKHYMLEELGELEEAKQSARNDMVDAEICYAALAAEINNA